MNFKFTPAQAKHAVDVARKLYKKERFFLPRGVNEDSPLPHLPVKEFREIYKLEQHLEDFYSHLTRRAELAIRDEEMMLGITRHKLSNGQALAECRRYSGGLEIVAVVPLSALMVCLPPREFEISDELLEARFPTTKRGSVTPDDLNMYRSRLDEYAKNVFAEHIELSRQSDYENKVVVVLDTRFAPNGLEDDLMFGKVRDLITYPNLTAYLTFKALVGGTRFTQKHFSVFTTSKSGHTMIYYNDESPFVRTGQLDGYDQCISFATIL